MSSFREKIGELNETIAWFDDCQHQVDEGEATLKPLIEKRDEAAKAMYSIIRALNGMLPIMPEEQENAESNPPPMQSAHW